MQTAFRDVSLVEQVIHYDPESGRSVLCLIRLDYSCGTISWIKISYAVTKDTKEKEAVSSKQAAASLPSSNPDASKSNNPPSSNKAQGYSLYFAWYNGIS
ncbi:hypothetical protein KIN20_004808 [Parelaphostrongylus tenuis]|uniref:Uncharacterized protein n=1 Tax=Parelaphostrongylus tenuis TaxID=148309 RepID=A0AAD5M2B2_PARTN|nr:hypothetical protein KIN20_004808 [Parelaphostrongylus tenuis]